VRVPIVRYITLALSALFLSAVLKATTLAQGKPPAVAGIGLGMSAAEVSAVLGGPEVHQASLGMRFWEYRARGITVIWRDDAAGAHGIVVNKRIAGEMNGVRVGDDARSLSSQWGPPVRVRQSGRFLDFSGNGWTLSAEIAGGRAVELTLLAAH
jgi:hypothetical protein